MEYKHQKSFVLTSMIGKSVFEKAHDFRIFHKLSHLKISTYVYSEYLFIRFCNKNLQIQSHNYCTYVNLHTYFTQCF